MANILSHAVSVAELPGDDPLLGNDQVSVKLPKPLVDLTNSMHFLLTTAVLAEFFDSDCLNPNISELFLESAMTCYQTSALRVDPPVFALFPSLSSF